MTLYKGSGIPFDGLAHLDSSTAKTEIARPARAIKEGEVLKDLRWDPLALVMAIASAFAVLT